MNPRVIHMRDVYVTAPDEAWVVGWMEGDRQCLDCGVVLHHKDGSWRILDRYEFRVNGRVAPLNAIDMVQDGDGVWYGWAVGDDATFDNIKAIILRFIDGEWRVWAGSNNIAKNLYDVKVLSPEEAWAVGADGAESWYMEVDGVGGWPRLGHSGVDTLMAVDLADPLFGWDGGETGRMNRYEGACHDDTPATQCWFDNRDRPIRDKAGSKLPIDIFGIDLLSRTEGWLVAAPYVRRSVVAYLDGDLWRTVTVLDDPGQALYGLHMRNGQHGFAVGDDGVILEYSDDSVPTATPTPSVPPTEAATVTSTPSPSPTAPPELPSATATRTLSTTPTPTDGPTDTATPTASATATDRPTATPMPTEGPWVEVYVPAAMKGW
jgi:hypothetical protein